MKIIKKNQEIFIGILLVLVVGLFVFFFMRNEAKKDIIPEDNQIVDKIIGDEEETQKIDSEIKEEIEKVNDNKVISQSANKDSYNFAMDNARNAFNKGEYDRAVFYYNEALPYSSDKDRDTIYSGLFIVYSTQNNIDKAITALDTAISLNPLFTEYWKSKLSFLDEKTSVSFLDLKKIYEEGLEKTDPSTKINLVTYFATIAENNKENEKAIELWEYAIELYPQNTEIYQAEIDSLK